jgi:nucleotide-binding universal stress UspA family protein
VMHAFELPFVGFPDGNVTVSAEMASKIIDAAEKAMAEAVRKHSGRRVVISTFLEQADPREAIFNAAKKVEADLIVIGTHGRRGFARALIGSTAEAVVRTSTIPVLTVHAAPAKSG